MKVEKRLRQLNSRSFRLTTWAVACGVAAALLLAFQLAALSEIISRVFLEGQTRQDVSLYIALFLVLTLARATIAWIREILAQRAATHLKSDLRHRLTTHLLRLGPAYTVAERSGELVNTAISGIETLDEYITQYLPTRYLSAIVPVLLFLIVVLIDPLTSLVLIFAGPMLILLLALIGGRTKAITERRFVEMSWMSAFFLDMLQGLETMKLFGRSREQTDNIREISRQYGQTTMDILRTAFQTSLVMEWAATAATAMVALEVSLRMMNGSISFNQALTVLLLTPEFFMPLRRLSLKYHAGTAGKAAAERIFEVLDIEPHRPQAPVRSQMRADKTANGRSRSSLPAGDISLHNVHVRYDSGRRTALNGVSLTIGHGQKVALVGPTGAGKSTVANLLLRFIDPDEGMITVGDRPLAEIMPDTWREHMAWVPQNPHLFHGTVAENLRLARPQATVADLVAAAQAAYAHDFIAALPQGYDTPIGENGFMLSGGQRQRLAIARVFLKDTPIIILDEATANLDFISESLVRNALERLTRGRTVLIIAHRLHMVQDVDEIWVIAGGRIAERGSHQNLLARGGQYAALYQHFYGGVE
ncbi:MAG: thiol reductant ABC exporter subunit CydD [Candidatus Promineifilaceae bacterium]|nr:thiol reductant ABC exporter subunit CydD [Candidatus Promineifilaceae bacterium]